MSLSAFSMPVSDLPPLDEELVMGLLAQESSSRADNAAILEYFTQHTDLAERSAYCKHCYKQIYTNLFVDDHFVGFIRHDMYLELWEGNYLTKTAQVNLTWDAVSTKIAELIEQGKFIVPIKAAPALPQMEQLTHRNELLQEDDFSIVQQFQAEYRGLIQYYILAQNLSWFSTLYWVMETSLLKTLACKHRSSMKKQKKKYRTTTTSTSGKEVPCLQVVVPRPSKKPLVATWGGISLVHKRKAIIEDKPYKVYGGRTELVKRLLADTCELCGSKENIEVHHIRKLADVKNKGLLNHPTWAQVMAARNRKTLVVCRECHVAIHNGTINKPLS